MLSIDGVTDQFFDDIGAISGETTVFSSSATVGKDRVKFDEKRKPLIGKKRGKGGRTLASTTGTRSVLVVRVVALDSSTSSNQTVLSNRIFGTYGDMMNLRTGYQACSFGQLQLVPSANTKAVNGVVSVSIALNVKGVDPSIVENAVITSLTSLVGNPQSQFDHVMLCLPPGTASDWLAYGYYNYYLTVYNNGACLHPSVQMHEIGHNLNLGHSGLGTDKYGDQTCIMGYSYISDASTESPHMCFNGAKSFYLGWYASRTQTLDILSVSTFSPTTITLIGISDFKATTAGSVYVVVKLETGAIDYYISFNRMAGVNNETQAYPNQVLITSQRDNPSDSSIVSSMTSAGQSLTLTRVQSSSYDVKVSIVSIDVSRNPATAVITVSRSVTVSLDGPTVSRRPTTKPLRKPSSKPVATKPTAIKTRYPSSKPLATKPSASRSPTSPFVIRQGWTCGSIDTSKAVTYNTPRWFTECMKLCLNDSKCMGFFFQKSDQQSQSICQILFYNPMTKMVNTGSQSANIYCAYRRFK
jgi:hypothetical protein